MSNDFDALLDDARLPERTVPICLRGDLVAEFEELERKLEEEQRKPVTTSIETAPAGQDIAERIEALQQEMQQHTYTFRLRGLPKPEYRKLKSEHQPRQGDDGEPRREDLFLDANMETFPEPLVRACLVDPMLDGSRWQKLMDRLTDRQFEQLFMTAVEANRGRVDVPFSRAASQLLRSTESA